MSSPREQTHQDSLELQQSAGPAGPVKCLGQTFENDQARREHFLVLLKEKLQDPEFRKIPGFPKGSDEAILRMSDPPYYTACPNPFLEDFIRCYGKPYDPKESYEREPFAVDVSVGKTDQLYKAHGYHTKVPHLAIVPSILHYTKPGDIVLDGFCGSGMTGLAAQWCGSAPREYKSELEAIWQREGHNMPAWGQRYAILNDIGPAATSISAGFNIPCDTRVFAGIAFKILEEVETELGWMFQTRHNDEGTLGRIDQVVWSEVFSCPQCGGRINFVKSAMISSSGQVRDQFPCPSCGVDCTKKKLDKFYVSYFDKQIGQTVKQPLREPVRIRYAIGKTMFDKDADEYDMEILERIEAVELPAAVPDDKLPYMHMTHERARMDSAGITNVHHFYFRREAILLGRIWSKILGYGHHECANLLRFWFDSQLANLSIQNRFRPQVSFPYNPLNGVYYVSSMICEADYLKAYTNKLKRIVKGFDRAPNAPPCSYIETGDCADLRLPGCSIDYVFTDPPFGENIYYSNLNYLVESWYEVVTESSNEAIVDRAKKKGVNSYATLMRDCFREYFRVLKPGRWMTVVFSNSSNGIWRAIQEGMGSAGFVIADVRTLDKQQGSYRQVTSSAVKQDLVISAYKPTEALEKRFELGKSSAEAAWAFVREHLHNVPVFVGHSNEVEPVVERTAQMLLDRMIAFHVQHGVSVPLSGPEFLQGLAQRFPARDGMYFLSDQVTEYDRKRTSATQLRQLSFFVNDEHSAIQWIRQQLQDKPQSFQDLQPQFMRELQAWAKHEQTVELKTILDQNFLQYDGRGPVPSQIHSYLSTNFKDLRNLDKENATLREKAQDRWYVPDPNKQGDLDQVRDRALLKEFEEVKESSQRKIKVFRTEAIRAGFKACWQTNDYATIVKVATKLPEVVLQEDEKLLMYVDNAQTRLGDDA